MRAIVDTTTHGPLAHYPSRLDAELAPKPQRRRFGCRMCGLSPPAAVVRIELKHVHPEGKDQGAAAMSYEARVWEVANRWRWSLFKDGDCLGTGVKSYPTRSEALRAARIARDNDRGGPTIEVVPLDD